MGKRIVTLGGGCFWCTEAVFVRVRGVLDVESGYCNGHLPNPTYQQVCEGNTGHAEVVRLVYDDAVIGLRDLLEIFFGIHDPTTLNRQGHDVGTQYRSGIYVEDAVDLALAQAFVQELGQRGVFRDPVVTEVELLTQYWPAEESHQDYFERHPHQGYCAFVVAPKVDKLHNYFQQWVRS